MCRKLKITHMIKYNELKMPDSNLNPAFILNSKLSMIKLSILIEFFLLQFLQNFQPYHQLVYRCSS